MEGASSAAQRTDSAEAATDTMKKSMARSRWPSFAALLILFLAVQCVTDGDIFPVAAQPDDGVAKALQTIAQQGKLPALRWPDFSDYRQLFQSAYQATGYSPLWLHNGQPTKQAYAVIQVLETSSAKGLDPEDYDGSRWKDRLAALNGTTNNDPGVLATFDAELTVCGMRYISDLHIGRVNPRHFNFGIDIEAKKYDLPQFLLDKVVHSENVQGVLDEVEPHYAAYKRTEEALHTYFTIQQKEQQENSAATLPVPSRPLTPGGTYQDVGPLAERLRLLGDLPSNATIDDGTNKYEGALVDAVRRFQERHGLAVNGTLGKDTFRELNTPIGARVLQLEDALERWRWLPPEYAVPPVVVNIPEFVLRAFEGNEEVALEMKVVVGKAYGRQTPVFTAEMKYIVLRPYWDVPQSIVRGETLPALKKDGRYLTLNHFEVTDFQGHVLSDGDVSESLLEQMRAGTVMVRQKPGADNALGLIKFIFPNDNNVYLHSTPAPQLFSQARRDFSHGCIRVEEPAELAAWLLRDQPQWNLDTIRAAMETGPNNRSVNLSKPIPVLIFYITAIVKDDGQVYFFDDIYGLDQSLNRVLAKGQPYP